MASMAEAPVLVESYLTMMGLFNKTELSETERQIILMTNNRLNGCTYCMAAHTAVSKKFRVDDEVIAALRSGSPINDPKLEALRQFAIIIHETHGRPTEEQIEAFLAAGYTHHVWDLLSTPRFSSLGDYCSYREKYCQLFSISLR